MLMNVTPSQMERMDAGPKPLWECRVFRLGMLVMLLGGALWAYSVMTGGGEPASAHGSPGAPRVATPAPGLAGALPLEPAHRMIDEAAPATFRLGAAFCGAYVLGWGLRRYARLTLLTAAAGAGAVFGLHKLGMLGIEWDEVRGQVDQSLEFVKGHADQMRTFAMGYMPTGIVGSLGLLMGFRHR